MPEPELESLRRNSRRLRDLCTLVTLGIGGPLVGAHLLVPAVTRAVSPAPGFERRLAGLGRPADPGGLLPVGAMVDPEGVRRLG